MQPDFCNREPAKAAFVAAVSSQLRSIAEVRSLTFTGSFVEKPGLSGISDIDVVVVVESLTEACFMACKSAVASVSPATLGLPDHRLIINDTFGPLKFDEPGVIVVHLMIYDLQGHREHVLKSPFTCLDWERSPFQVGSSLRILYPVLSLQPRQFLEARRSLGNYLDDIAAGAISYRRHVFADGNRREALERLPLDQRHQGEYAFHIIRNLVANYAKLLRRENLRLDEPALLDFWRMHLPGCARHLEWFGALSMLKHSRQSDFPADTPTRTKEFLADFTRELDLAWNRRAIKHLFVRHAATDLNDGSFLGQRRDPAASAPPPALATSVRRVFASPARRCRETAAGLMPGATVRVDDRLHEIDYGQAEGLTFAGLAERHPEIPAGWQRGEDPAFPGGENTEKVANRLKAFLADLPAEPSLVVTHNVVLRCLLGAGLGLPRSCWHRIPVAHLEPIELLRLDGVDYLNLTPDQVARISDTLAGHLA